MEARTDFQTIDDVSIFWRYLALVPTLFLISALTLIVVKGNLGALYQGLNAIMTFVPGQINDFLAIGGLEASLINAGLIAGLNVFLIRKFQCPLEGKLIAAFFTVVGFSFCGKTLLNIIPIYLGGGVYGILNKRRAQEILPVVLFASSLAPVVSWLAHQPFFPQPQGMMVAVGVGMILGYGAVPIAYKLPVFHQGYSLYHVGFCTGMMATLVASLGRLFHLEMFSYKHVANGSSEEMFPIVLMIVLALFGGALWFKRFQQGMTENLLLNMALLGMVGLAYICFWSRTITGLHLAALFTLIGFGACGKNLANCLPVMAGAVGGIMFLGLNISDPTLVAAVLFATTLAPIVTSFGKIAGMLAGLCHLFLVGEMADFHNGLCLYNNGFTGGLVAGSLVALLERWQANKIVANDVA